MARARAPFSRQVRALNGLPKILASSGDFDVVLATTKKEIRRAQKLRFKVFFEEGGATPDPTARLIRRDVCRFDSVCDHLIVVDVQSSASTARRRSSAPTGCCAKTSPRRISAFTAPASSKSAR